MKILTRSVCLLSVLSSIASVKCKPKSCVQYHYSIKPIADNKAVVGSALLDLNENKFLLDVQLQQSDNYKHSFEAVKFHIHRHSQKVKPNYETCQDLGGHYDPLLFCGPKSEYNTTSCQDKTKPRGRAELGDLSGQYDGKYGKGSISLKPAGTKVEISMGIEHFKYVKGLSFVMHADDGTIIACSEAKIRPCSTK